MTKKIVWNVFTGFIALNMPSVSAYDPAEGYVTMFTNVIIELTSIICDLKDVVQTIAGILAVFAIVFAGAKYIYAADNPQERKNTKDRLIHVVIGLMIIMVAAEFVGLLFSGYC